MPDIFPQCVNFEADITCVDNVPDANHFAYTLQQRIDFPLVVVDTSKRIINELLAWETDVGLIGSELFAAQTAPVNDLTAISLTLARPAPTDIILKEGTTATAPTGESIGNTNVIDRMQSLYVKPLVAGASNDGRTSCTSMSLGRGGLGVLVPQEYVWLNFRCEVGGADADQVCRLGVRIWYRQRTVKADEYLGLLASRMQLTTDE